VVIMAARIAPGAAPRQFPIHLVARPAAPHVWGSG
jgi:hypothetical protein